MSEEEIIDILENVFIFKNTSDKFTDLDLNAIKGLLDLYNKQKEENKKDIKGYSKMINSLEEQLAHKTKEIKELNLENQAFYEEMNCNDNEYISKKYSQLKENSISKDKIRNEIKELEKDIEIFSNDGCDTKHFTYCKDILNELLEE